MGILISQTQANTPAEVLQTLPAEQKEVFSESLSQVCHTSSHCKVTPLDGGFSAAKVYLIQNGYKKYVLKLSDLSVSQSQMLQAFEAHRLVSEIHLAPKIQFADPLGRALLMDFIPGTHASHYMRSHRNYIRHLPKLLRKLHQTKPSFPVFTVFDEIHQFFESSKKRGAALPSDLPTLLSSLKPLREALDRNSDHVLGHGDLAPVNLLVHPHGSEPLSYLIDWDSARFTYRFEDLSNLALYLQLSPVEHKILVREYLGSDTLLPSHVLKDKDPAFEFRYWFAQSSILQQVALVKGALWAMDYAYRPESEHEPKLTQSEMNERMKDPSFVPIQQYVFPARRMTVLEFQEAAIRCLKQYRNDIQTRFYQEALSVLSQTEF